MLGAAASCPVGGGVADFPANSAKDAAVTGYGRSLAGVRPTASAVGAVVGSVADSAY